MRAKLHSLFVALGIIGVLAVVAPRAQDIPDQPAQTFRSAVDVVTIQASVRDARGRVVSGLTSNDFEVRDNGQVRPILSLRADRQSPLSVAILVDMSGSMRIGAKIPMARQAYDSILTQLRQGEDEAAVLTFDASLHQRHDFTRDLGALKGALSNFEPFGTTSLFRRHGGGRAEAGGAHGHTQGHHRAHRRHRHEQRHDGPGGVGPRQFD